MADAVELVRLRNNFYRDNYRRVVSALLLAIIIIIALIGVVFYMITHQPTPKYFATTSDGSLIELTALDRPNQSNSAVAQWANEAAVAAYTFNFVDYRKALQSASDYFTQAGWKQFIAELDKSNNLRAIINRKLVMSSVATGAPVILEQGNIRGRYSWQIQMPMLVVLESASQTIHQAYNINMIVTRVSTLDNPKGIAINSFVATQRSGLRT
jgi:intracellular multiplication protein IcmL